MQAEEATIQQLFDDKLKIVLNLIRTNNTGDEALKITQAAQNLVLAKLNYRQQVETDKTQKKPGANAT